MNNETGVEARGFRRFSVKENILVFNETTFAKIIDISEAGLSCKYLANLKDTEHSVNSIDLLNGPDKLHVRNIICEEIHYRDELISPTFPSTVLRTCGIKFSSLEKEKQDQLRDFIVKSRIDE